MYNMIKRFHKPVDIVYVPMINSTEIITHFFTNSIHFTNRAYCLKNDTKAKKQTIENLSTRQCYICNTYSAKI